MENKEITKKNLKEINSAKDLAKWFSLDLTIKLFGVEIITWHYPPLTERN